MTDKAVMTDSQITPEKRSGLRMLVFVICATLLVACGDTLSHFSSYHKDLDVKGLNFAAADRLLQNAGNDVDQTTPIYGKALKRAAPQDSGTRRTPPLAGVVVEHAAQRLKRHGYNIQPAAKTGEEIKNGLVLSGLYTPKPDSVGIVLVLETARNGQEISSFSYSLERTFQVDKLMRTRPVRNEAKELMDQMIKSF
jgi:hypothetical protein